MYILVFILMNMWRNTSSNILKEGPSDYGALANVSRSKEDTQKDAFSLSDVDDFLNNKVDTKNYQLEFVDEIDYDEFDS